jgi:RHS repeat-associated protein
MGSVRTRYLYDLSGHVVAELQTAPPPGYTGWTAGYVCLNGQLLAQYSNGTTYFAHKDHLGSTRVLTPYPYAGAAYESYDYLPFGEQTAGGIATKHKFTGKERDGESGLDYFGARYYASSMGRYLSLDWSETPQPVPYADFGNPQTLNLYAYVGNNPLNATDPDGHCCAYSASSFSDFIDSGVYRAVEYVREKAVSSGNPTAAGAATFLAGATGDIAKGFTTTAAQHFVGDH